MLVSFKGIFQVMFSIIALEFFNLQPEQNGYLMAYFGIVQMVSLVSCAAVCGDVSLKRNISKTPNFLQVIQGAVIGRLTGRYSETSLLLLSIGISSLVGLAQVHAKHKNVLFWTGNSRHDVTPVEVDKTICGLSDISLH